MNIIKITKAAVRSEFYPVDWAEIATLVKEANGYACQSCGRQCRQPGEAFDENARTLTVAHWHNDYDAPWVQLVPLCSICHLIHDAPFGMSARRRHERGRMRQAGQLEFTLEGKRI